MPWTSLAELGAAAGRVITFADAARVSVSLHVEAGQLVTDPPQAYPPPGWEL